MQQKNLLFFGFFFKAMPQRVKQLVECLMGKDLCCVEKLNKNADKGMYSLPKPMFGPMALEFSLASKITLFHDSIIKSVCPTAT